MDYSYKKGSDKYRIRFYLNQKNKVTAVVFLKNLEQFYKWPNKELKTGLDFQAPEGKKVTTKTINGKKVYMLPKGTKIVFKKGVMSEQEFKRMNTSIAMYNAYGAIIAGSAYEYNAIELGEGIDLESMINTSVVHTDWEGGSPSDTSYINIEKLGEYLYFTIICDNFVYNTDGQGGSRSKAPAIYYFKFK